MDLSIYLSEIHKIPQKSEDLPWISPPNIENIEDIEDWRKTVKFRKTQIWLSRAEWYGINTNIANVYVGKSQ